MMVVDCLRRAMLAVLLLVTATRCQSFDDRERLILEQRLERIEDSLHHLARYSANHYVSVGCKSPSSTYFGTATRTGDGKLCQRWDQQFPHSHSFSGESNYCRNPSANAAGPWCYTKDPNTRWQFCDIKSCHEEVDCKLTSEGHEYRGRLSVSAPGIDCVQWAELPDGAEQVDDQMFPDGSVISASNYCRNPSNDSAGPYCYDSESQKRYCDIKFCASAQFEFSTPSTPGNQPYIYLPEKRFPSGGNQLYFSVKAKNDVYITLTPSGADGYEIVIGGWNNTRSVLRTCHQCEDLKVTYHSPRFSPLSEDEYRDFWIVWQSGMFYVGFGLQPYKDTFLHYEVETADCINTLGFHSGWGSSADWIFYAGPECRETALGKDYVGRTSYSAAGLKCQRWDSQTPREHEYNEPDMFPMDSSVEAAADFCRNPSDSLGGPWCYQIAGSWNYCDIPFCEPIY